MTVAHILFAVGGRVAEAWRRYKGKVLTLKQQAVIENTCHNNSITAWFVRLYIVFSELVYSFVACFYLCFGYLPS